LTYCVGILVQNGLVMIADTRTNAGLDNVATFRKLHVTAVPGERMIALATAGNLAVTQSVLSLVTEGFGEEDADGPAETLMNVPTMFAAAQLVGKAIRQVYASDGKALEAQASSFDVQMLVAGQVAGRRLRLFQVYSAGNFIEAQPDTPYLQIGEHKYGKPILDRAITYGTPLPVALKLGLISMDSTMRSNLGVGMPIDLLAYRLNSDAPEVQERVDVDDPYFADLRHRWSTALKKAHEDIPLPPYGGGENGST